MRFTNEQGIAVVRAIIEAVCAQRELLSQVDAAVGDGDHGVNMSRGFSLAGEALNQRQADMSEGFLTIAKVLIGKIGGSMGPLYGSFFRGLAEASKDKEMIDAVVIGEMVRKGYDRLALLTEAQPGDKTLIDVLDPAVKAYEEAANEGGHLEACLARMLEAAEAGLEATKGMAARLGRGSRLGDRAIGHQDAGATSCYIILKALSDQALLLANTD